MQKNIQNLVKIAQFLDNHGNTDAAASLDKIVKNLLQIKTAQYVGTQGYAIRNSRCWGNCYRHKRTETPKKSAQVIWTECHEEYVNSLNNDGSKWDKYANDAKTIKTASSSDYLAFKKDFATKVTDKIVQGFDYGTSIVASIAETKDEQNDKVLHAAEEILKVAEKIQDSKIGKKLAETANDMLKEAAFGDIGDSLRGAYRGTKDWAASKGTTWQINTVFEKIKRNTVGVTKSLEDTFFKIDENIKYLNSMAQKNQDAAGEIALTERITNFAAGLEKAKRALSQAFYAMSEISHEVMGDVASGAGKHKGNIEFSDPGDDPDRIADQVVNILMLQGKLNKQIAQQYKDKIKQQITDNPATRRQYRDWSRSEMAKLNLGY